MRTPVKYASQFAGGEGLAARRRAGVHDQRLGPAARLRLPAQPLELENVALEVDVLRTAHSSAAPASPLRAVGVAVGVTALSTPNISNSSSFQPQTMLSAEAPFADVVGSHDLLGGDDRVEQRRVHRPEDEIRLVAASRPAAHVSVSKVVPW